MDNPLPLEIKQLDREPPTKLLLQMAGFYAKYSSGGRFVICSAINHLIHGQGATEDEAWGQCINKRSKL